MASAGNPNWEVESSITFSSKGDHEKANFIYKVQPPLSDLENIALISTGLMLGASVEEGGIDPDGESIVEPMAMGDYENDEPVASLLKVSGESEPMKRVRNLDKIAGALTVMRKGGVEIVFDEEARQVSQVV